MSERDANPTARTYVHLDHGRSFENWRRRFDRGEVWESTPYSYGLAEAHLNLSNSRDHAERSPGRLMRRGLYFILGFDLVHAWRNRDLIDAADVVWTHTEHEHLAVRAVERLRHRAPKPMIAQSVWLWDSWRTTGRLRRWLYRALLRGPAVHTTLSRDNAAIAASVLSTARVSVVPFGTSDISRPTDAGGSRVPGGVIVAPGNDRHRDWATLVEASGLAPSLPTLILSRRRIESADRSPWVRVTRSGSAAETVAAYLSNEVVVVPLIENHHASGITVGLEAMSLGRSLVIADTGGARDYFEGYAEFYRVGDVRSLRDAIDRARSGGGPRVNTKSERGLHGIDYVLRHVAITQLLLGERSSIQGVDSFAPFRLSVAQEREAHLSP